MFTAWILLMLNSLFFTLRLSGGGSGSFPRPLKAEEERMYLERMAQGDLEARNILIEHNLRLVAHIMKKYYTPNGDQDDLISIGTIGLIKGISTFKPDKNVRLATYASRCIENEILMHFRAQRKLQGEVSLSDSIDGDGDGNSLSLMDTISVDDNMLEELDARDSCAKVRRCVKRCLDEREAMIITLRYGLNARPPLTQREIAAQSPAPMYRAAAIASAEGDVSGGRDGPDGDATLTAVSEREKPASRREARSAGRAADINTSGTVSSADTGGIRPPGQ